MKLRAKKGEGAIETNELESASSGLICLTGGDEGPLAYTLRSGGKESARKCLEQLCAIFGRNNVYVELQRHFSIEEERRNQVAVELARDLRLPLLATNGVCHALPPQREILDVFTCLRNHRVLANAARLLSCNSERYLKSPVQMAALFADLPEAIANTAELASRLKFTLKDLGYKFPIYPTPNNESQMEFMRQRTLEGMVHRYGTQNERATLQIQRELSIIERLDLAGYFLIVWDIVRFCRENNILVQGRGSAANSAVCYALGITAVDPVGMNLLFERFLSEERTDSTGHKAWPDIDLDLPSGDQREKVKVLGLPQEELDRLSKLLPHFEFTTDSDSLQNRAREAGLAVGDRRVGLYLQLCRQIAGLPRHLGQHSGGMIIARGRLDEIVPLEPASMPGRMVVQWDKDDCADLGIIKIDLLGLGMMAVLEQAIPLVRAHEGVELDLAQLPPDDPGVYRLLQTADTVGVFQVESRAQMATLPRMRPDHFYDIVVEVAIIRPGPIVGQMVNPYLERRAGRQEPSVPHPSLWPVLERTLGVPLFQEQLMRIAMTAANFTGGEADELRRAIGSKRSVERMKHIEQRLREGMTANGITPKAQDEIVQSITSFALYGFPESHAASFALIVYASAYLKVHHPHAFYAAMLNCWPMGFYSPATLVKDAQRRGVRVKPIDAARSDWLCTLERAGPEEELCLRLGLRYVRGLREALGRKLVEERSRAPFASIADLAARAGLRRDELAALAEIGALASVPARAGGALPTRRAALWQAEASSRRAQGLFARVEPRGDELGADFSGAATPSPPLVTVAQGAAGNQPVA